MKKIEYLNWEFGNIQHLGYYNLKETGIITYKMIIKIKYYGNWVFANPDYCEAFRNYKNQPIYSREEPVSTGSLIVYRLNNDVYLPTYIRDGNDVYPIAEIFNFAMQN